MTAHPQARQPRLAVVGQFRMVVEALAHTLSASARVRTVVLETSLSTATARDAVLRVKADAVVLVLEAADTLDAHGMVAALAERGQRVVVAGAISAGQTGSELLAAGAAALHTEDITQVRQLVDLAVRHALLPQPVPRTYVEPVLTSERRIRRNLGSLTTAEARILWRLMHGMSVADIARDHVVSVATVRSQIRTVLAKMETTSKLAAVAQAWSIGWRPAPATISAA